MLIDTHCHLNSLDAPTIADVLLEAKHNYIFIDVSIDSASSKQSLAVSAKNDCVFSSLGFHALSDEKFSREVIDGYKRRIQGNEKVVAIGEIGLDYKSKRLVDEQEEIFIEMLALAKELDLPVAIHNRWHNNRVFEILDAHYAQYDKVIFHCFSQDKEFLDHIVQRKSFASFSLNIFREKKAILSALDSIPMDNLLLETDSPYMRYEGRTSLPLDIEKVYAFVAKRKNISLGELQEALVKNVSRIFPSIIQEGS